MIDRRQRMPYIPELVSAATSEDVVVVSYTPPSDAATARTRDLAGNAAAGFNSTEVFNDTDETAESEENGEPEETTEGETPLTVSLGNLSLPEFATLAPLAD